MRAKYRTCVPQTYVLLLGKRTTEKGAGWVAMLLSFGTISVKRKYGEAIEVELCDYHD